MELVSQRNSLKGFVHYGESKRNMKDVPLSHITSLNDCSIDSECNEEDCEKT